MEDRGDGNPARLGSMGGSDASTIKHCFRKPPFQTNKMKIFVRTLKNDKYELDVAPEESVLSVKQRIHSQYDLGDVDSQKLIYSGKILKDEQSVDSSGIKEGGFLVLMIKKEKPTKDKQTTTVPPPSQPPAVPAPAPASVTPAAPASVTPAAPASYDAASNLVRVMSLDTCNDLCF